VQRALALRDVMQHAVQAEQAAAVRRAPRARGYGTVVACAIVLLVCAWSFVVRPEFIWGKPAAEITAEREEAAIRFAMHLLARRAESHRAAYGEYPLAGDLPTDSTIHYTRLSDSAFQIAASVRGRRLVLASSDDLAAFLGNSASLIQQGGSR
jgi:hypothetical protein